jgi:hypothetical protein
VARALGRKNRAPRLFIGRDAIDDFSDRGQGSSGIAGSGRVEFQDLPRATSWQAVVKPSPAFEISLARLRLAVLCKLSSRTGRKSQLTTPTPEAPGNYRRVDQLTVFLFRSILLGSGLSSATDNDTMEAPHITRLPTETIQLIGSVCHPSDLVALSRTCRRLYETCNGKAPLRACIFRHVRTSGSLPDASGLSDE